MAALSQAQAEANKEAQRAGIAHVKAGKQKVYLGRKPSYTEDQISKAVKLTGEGKGGSAVANELGMSRAATHRLLKHPADA